MNDSYLFHKVIFLVGLKLCIRHLLCARHCAMYLKKYTLGLRKALCEGTLKRDAVHRQLQPGVSSGYFSFAKASLEEFEGKAEVILIWLQDTPDQSVNGPLHRATPIYTQWGWPQV